MRNTGERDVAEEARTARQRLETALGRIVPADAGLEPAARARLDDLTKPRGSLGRLEDVAAALYVMAGGVTPLRVDPVQFFTVAADHGVAAEGVSAYAQDVTRQMVQNFLAGGAAVNVLCRTLGIGLRVVDAGCKGGAFPAHPVLTECRLGDGTANMATGPAMTEQACIAGLLAGMDLAAEAVAAGARCLGIGEMGIGNTTAASALFSAWLGLDPRQLTGPGTGLNGEGVRRKADVIARALSVNAGALRSGDPVSVLAALGGFEIAVMAGVVLGAAAARVPCLVDGFIAQSAYLAALKLCPAVRAYTFVAHASAEPGSAVLLPALEARPLLNLGMRLGEGTGAALAVPLLRAAAALFNDMATFSGTDVSGRLYAGGAPKGARP